MKKHMKSIAGVTLLEIMLVLAIASLVIMMSVRYYQSATNANNANAVMEALQNLTAAADNLSQTGGSYSAATTAAITGLSGATSLNTPYGAIVVSAPTQTSYTVTVPAMGSGPCGAVLSRVRTNSKYTGAACSATGVLTYTYNASS